MTTRPFSVPTSLVLLTGLVVVIGSLTRLYDLDRMVVWHDEVFTAVRVYGFPQDELTRFVFSGHLLDPADLLTSQRPNTGRGWGDTLAALTEHPEHGPLYYLVARLASGHTDDPLLAIRGTSAVLGIFLIPAIFWLALELFRDAKTTWVAAALAACSPLHLLYAQEARQYALWTAVTAAASAAFLRAYRSQRRRDWGLYGGLVAIGLYSHLLFALVLAAHAGYGVLLTGQARRPLGAFLRTWSAAVALSLLLFAPWLLVIVTGSERVDQYTGWMARPVPPLRTFENWGMHLVRIFADFPAAGAMLLFGLVPLSAVVWRFARTAPRGALLFLTLLFAVFAGAVLLPDLILGGSRSLHPRYLLPGFLAIELAVAYVLASGWDATSTRRRLTTRAGLVLLLGLGVTSELVILRADTWWSKNYSSENHAIALLINQAERPLILASDSGVALGEIISLAYALKHGVMVWGEPDPGSTVDTAGFTDLFALTPSEELRNGLLKGYTLVPLLDSWQWYRAVPKERAAAADPGPAHVALSRQTNPVNRHP
jgi:uncharacterized membrane protein